VTVRAARDGLAMSSISASAMTSTAGRACNGTRRFQDDAFNVQRSHASRASQRSMPAEP
jgi:hypothetical protein